MINLMKNLVIFAVASTASLFGQDVQIVKEGPIHEAFVTRDTENFTFDVVPVPPPFAINERVPPQTDRQAVWVPGYWFWDENRNDYIWMSGVWRRPPPHHQWIPGTWQHMNQGWVWISGFWSNQPTNNLSFIETAPPEPMHENISQPNGGEFFWSPGYWEFSERGRGYAWVSGHWERLDPNWIQVPARYVWYNDNYVFIPAYWDWRLEDRGTVFSPVYIPPHVRQTIVYQPVVVVEQPIIVRRLYDYYPDYFGFFFHLNRYRPELCLSIGITPNAPRRAAVCNTRRQPVNVRTVRQDRQDPRRAQSRQIVDRQDPRQVPSRGEVVDRQNRQVPGSGSAVRPGQR